MVTPAKNTSPSQFICVDGEGITHQDGTHNYVLLSVGQNSYHKNGKRLTFDDCMTFLYRQFQLAPNAIFAGFYLSYDFSQWLRDIDKQTAWMLLDERGIALRRPKDPRVHTPFPVRFGNWEFDILNMRRWRLRPAMNEPYLKGNRNHWQWMTINDVGPFWQSSFMMAIDPNNWNGDPIVTPDEYELIKEGKAQRSTAVFDPAMIRYNVTENLVLARAMNRLRDGFVSQGWNLRKTQWYGPGQIAQAWMESINAPTGDDVRATVPRNVLAAARSAYYGGWFEIPRHGHVGTVYEYDINSAYPYIIASLPCLLHGKWSADEHGEYTLLHVTTQGSDPFLGGLPNRDSHGIICRPRSTEGWYWKHEIQAAMRAGLIDRYLVHETWSYHPCDCPPPLSSIASLYEERLRIGKNTPTGKALKIVYNSAYGKTAQSVGMPKYANALYAGLITAGCRTMILDAIATHPLQSKAVMMVATDGVYFSSAHPRLPIDGAKLGAWDETKLNGLTLFMPGIYWSDNTRQSIRDGSAKLKSRGINANDLAAWIDHIDLVFKLAFDEWPSIELPIRFSVTSPKQALQRGKWDTCGAITTDGMRKIDSTPESKRNPDPYYLDGRLTTHPYDWVGVSVPYDKMFGDDPSSEFSDDGDVNRELIELLKG